MDFVGRMIQGNVFQIGSSVGVVIEFNCPNLEEAVRFRETIQIVLDAALEVHFVKMDRDSGFTTIGGRSLEETIHEVVEILLHAE